MIADAVIDAIRTAADPTEATLRWCEEIRSSLERCRVLAVGKGGATMMRAAAGSLGDRVNAGLVIAPDATIEHVSWPECIAAVGSDHPTPTERSVRAAEIVRQFVGDGDETLVVLLSGGGSAMVAAPLCGVTLADIIGLSDALMRGGATIEELNAVRKRLDRTKGGGLGLACNGRPVLVGVVSDVIGDRLDVVSSGPFFGDLSSTGDARAALDRCGVEHASIRRAIEAADGTNPAPDDPRLATIEHSVLTSNRVVIERVAARLREDHATRVLQLTDQRGEAQWWGRLVADGLQAGWDAVVIGGESVVSAVPAGAKGGPVQEAVLAAGRELASDSGWLVVGFATDGIDGPTDAAGAVLDPVGLSKIVEIDRALAEHRSFDALDGAGALIRTGPTGTNVNDVLVGIRVNEGSR